MRSSTKFTRPHISHKFARALRPFVHVYTDHRRAKIVANEIRELLPALSDLRLTKQDIVIDLGANRGDFSYWALTKGATVFAFEPMPEAFRYLVRRLSKTRGFHAFQLAISDESALSAFYVDKDANQDPLGFSIRSSLMKMTSGFYQYTTVFTLDFEEVLRVVKNVRVLKIDIEGAEQNLWSVIKNNFDSIDFLMIEIHDSVNPRLRMEILNFIRNRNLIGKWTVEWN